jgi:hypothetical protein
MVKITKLTKIRNYSSVDDLLESVSRVIEKITFEKDEFLYISDKKILDVQDGDLIWDWNIEESSKNVGLDLTAAYGHMGGNKF